MTIKADTPDQYIDQLPDDRKAAMQQLRKVILDNLPEGFAETISYGMIGYVVPHTIYPDGYHCDPKLPLPFMSIASQKGFIAVYHMGLYADPALMDWFLSTYSQQSKTKPDIGKSCIRFKKIDQIPYGLIGELSRQLSPEQWISLYKTTFKK